MQKSEKKVPIQLEHYERDEYASKEKIRLTNNELCISLESK